MCLAPNIEEFKSLILEVFSKVVSSWLFQDVGPWTEWGPVSKRKADAEPGLTRKSFSTSSTAKKHRREDAKERQLGVGVSALLKPWLVSAPGPRLPQFGA